MTGKDQVLMLGPDLHQTMYQLANIKLTTFGNHTMAKILNPFIQLISPTPIPGVPETNFKRASDVPQQMEFTLPLFTRLILPDKSNKEDQIPVSHFLFIYWAEKAKLANTNGIDPTIFSQFAGQLEYKDELTGEVRILDGMRLQLGVDTKFEEGKYYYDPRFNGFSYFCEELEKEDVILILLESIQHGQLFRGEIREPANTSTNFLVVTDENEVVRLEGLLREFKKLRTSVPPTQVSSNARSWIT